ncbi:uncharacterized protein RCC_00177 [Ramularia collo-cygni]|uniref:Uncharacterized protein n=1 Tax=Ramularia collo-cygni TaxID=112498 RepID=A0A2D3V1U6_9PEZI|nr:uncharacterized protein RCC_00177 [Ramularia collo-cygni]CZT14203.1 uncharacterized protein RCC_00177 [Ramularia collo-cygni]
MSSLNFTPSDPNTTTREVFTSNITSVPVPSDASSNWRFFAETSKSLLDKLAHHSAMAPNLQQTYMTPAASKNKVYFMWDFVGRTLGYLYMLPVTATNMGDVESRSMMAAMLILDEQPGMLDQMVGATYAQTQTFEFGEDILADARRLKNGP